MFLVPKGPKKPAGTLLDHDFEVARRYLLDPPQWQPRFVYAPVGRKDMKDFFDFHWGNAFEVHINDPAVAAGLLTQTARAPRPTVLVAPLPDDHSNARYDSIVHELFLESDLPALRTGVFASVGQHHLGGWTGGDRFGCAGFSASALHPFDLARRVARRARPGSPDLTLIGLIDPPQFTLATAEAVAAWQRDSPRRAGLVVGGDHHEKIHQAVLDAGGGVEVHPPRPDFFARDPNAFARAVFIPPEAENWRAAPLDEATEEEIAAAHAAARPFSVKSGSTSDFVGWIRSTGPGRPLFTLDLVPVSMAPDLQKQLERLSTMELSGYIGWLHKQEKGPRKPARDLAAFVRKSSALRHQWAVASGDVLTQILARWK